MLSNTSKKKRRRRQTWLPRLNLFKTGKKAKMSTEEAEESKKKEAICIPVDDDAVTRTQEQQSAETCAQHVEANEVTILSESDECETSPIATVSRTSEGTDHNTSISQPTSPQQPLQDFSCIEKLSSECWVCSVQLRIKDGFCFYAMHVHPQLQVPLCSVCSDSLAAVSSEDGLCDGCGLFEQDDPVTLFQCDTCPDICPSNFCHACVAKANGGGSTGSKLADLLASNEENWSCPFCKPPLPLQKVQAVLDKPNESSSNQDRSIEDILVELDTVEVEMKECENTLEDQLEETLMDKWSKHHARLSDLASSLQDELETIHGVDLAKCYKNFFGENQDFEIEPDWKILADKALNKQSSSVTYEPSDPTVYDIDIPCDVEDLGSISDERETETSKMWRMSHCQPSKHQIERALLCDDELLMQNNVKVESINDSEDIQNILEEEKEVSVRGSSGISRVRKDLIFAGKISVRRKKKYSLGKRGTDANASEDAATNNFEDCVDSTKTASTKTNYKIENILSANLNNKEKPKGSNPETCTVGASPNIPTGINLSKAKNEISHTSKSPIVIDSSSDEDSVIVKEQIEDSWDSSLVLYKPDTVKSTDCVPGNIQPVTVSRRLENVLMPHQVEGVEFLWRNSFADIAFRNAPKEISDKVGGCILAHNMGLGKSLTVITLLYTILNHPSLEDLSRKRHNRRASFYSRINSIILVVPVNTLANWVNEFRRWVGDLNSSIKIYDIGAFCREARGYELLKWAKKGGILLVSDKLFLRLAKHCKYHNIKEPAKSPGDHQRNVVAEEVCPACATWRALQDPGPQAVFVDEAHLMLSNSKTEISKALSRITTKRRIIMTGSPFQNNLAEYYNMVKWVRPELLARSESTFEKEFIEPIIGGLASDSSAEAVEQAKIQSRKLRDILAPYISRKDVSVLKDVLPPMQQVVLHIRPTKTQTRLYSAFKKYKKITSNRNFFKEYQSLKPIHNHPGCLLLKEPTEANVTTEPRSGKGGSNDLDWRSEWWYKAAKERGVEQLKDVQNGSKIVLLLHILTYAEKLGDKVVLFSECLKTLDFIEDVLSFDSWRTHVSSLRSSFPEIKLGGWQKGNEYLRIDGEISPIARGDMITQFNNAIHSNGNSARLFLISSKAGGIGINLQAANRVVLFDSPFNPTVTLQALYRCYRFGQQKAVFVYRFLTEGTMEEKVYSRCVNKEGVSLRVIDGKTIGRNFTEKEVKDLLEQDSWVQCDKCEKWRMLRPTVEEENLQGEWYCEMNKTDPQNNDCGHSEKSNSWYQAYFQSEYEDSKINDQVNYIEKESSIDERKDAMTELDVILQHLLHISKEKKEYVSKYSFHEAMFEVVEDSYNSLDVTNLSLKKEEKEGSSAMKKKMTDPEETGNRNAEEMNVTSHHIHPEGIVSDDADIGRRQPKIATTVSARKNGRGSKCTQGYSQKFISEQEQSRTSSSSNNMKLCAKKGPILNKAPENSHDVSLNAIKVKKMSLNLNDRQYSMSLEDKPNIQGSDKNEKLTNTELSLRSAHGKLSKKASTMLAHGLKISKNPKIINRVEDTIPMDDIDTIKDEVTTRLNMKSPRIEKNLKKRKSEHSSVSLQCNLSKNEMKSSTSQSNTNKTRNDCSKRVNSCASTEIFHRVLRGVTKEPEKKLNLIVQGRSLDGIRQGTETNSISKSKETNFISKSKETAAACCDSSAQNIELLKPRRKKIARKSLIRFKNKTQEASSAGNSSSDADGVRNKEFRNSPAGNADKSSVEGLQNRKRTTLRSQCSSSSTPFKTSSLESKTGVESAAEKHGSKRRTSSRTSTSEKNQRLNKQTSENDSCEKGVIDLVSD